MKIKRRKQIGIGICLILGLLGLGSCKSADAAKGSNEKWLSQADSQAVIVKGTYYMPDFDQNQIYVWHFQDQSLSTWDFVQEANLEPSKILRITSFDDQHLAIWTQTKEEATGLYEMNPLTINLWNLEENRLERQIQANGSGQMLGEDLYWIVQNQLWHQSVNQDEAEMVADLSTLVGDMQQVKVETVQDLYVIVSAEQYSPESVRIYFKIDRSEQTVSSFAVQPENWGAPYYSVAYLIGADDEKLYFQIYGAKQVVYFSTDLEGKKAELITLQDSLSNPPCLSEKGIYSVVSNRKIGNFDNPRQCQVIRQQNYDKTPIATVDCDLETRLTRVGGWLKTATLSGNGMHRISLIQPETGKTYEVVQNKNAFYQEQEDQALDGIDQPMQFDQEVPAAQGSALDPGELLTLEGKVVEVEDKILVLSANGKTLQQLNPETGTYEERYFISQAKYPRGRMHSMISDEDWLFIKATLDQPGGMDYLLILDNQEFTPVYTLENVRLVSAAQGKVYYIRNRNGTEAAEVRCLDLASGEDVLLLDERLFNNESYGSSLSGITYDDVHHCLWLIQGGFRSGDLYQYDMTNQTLTLKARPEQIDTYNEQSFLLTPSARPKLLLGLWQAEDLIGDNVDYYFLEGNQADLLIKDISMMGSAVLTQRGAFTAELSDGDYAQPFQDYNSPSYRPYSTIYYRSGERKDELFQLDSMEVELAYLPSVDLLWLRAQDKQSEYPQETWISYLYDLNSGELRTINEETFNIYE